MHPNDFNASKSLTDKTHAGAVRAARRWLGTLTSVRCPTYTTRSALHYAIRGMLRNSGFSLLACLSLAIGIGANTAIYSVIDAVLLRPPR